MTRKCRVSSPGATFIHPLAEVEDGATVGAGSKIWRYAHVRAGAEIGSECIVGAGVFVDRGVRVGRRCKIQNKAQLFEGVCLEDGVFVGPQVCFTNDYLPRAVTPEGMLKSADDWQVGETLVREGASVGANSVVITGVTIGRWALVGAGAVVTHDVPDHALVFGSPARQHGWVCYCARRLDVQRTEDGSREGWCATCRRSVPLASPAQPKRAPEPVEPEPLAEWNEELVALPPSPERRIVKLNLLAQGLPWNDDGLSQAQAIVEEHARAMAHEGWEIQGEVEFQVSGSEAGQVITMATMLLERIPAE